MQRGLRLVFIVALIFAASGLTIPQEQPAKPRVDALGDPLPPGAVARLGTNRFHFKPFNIPPVSVAGGKALLLYDFDNDPMTHKAINHGFRWIDGQSGKELDRWQVPLDATPIAVSQDGHWMMAAQGTGWQLYDMTAKKPARAFDGMRATHYGTACVFSADGKYFAALTSSVGVWETATGKEMWTNVEFENDESLLDLPRDNSKLVMRLKGDQVVAFDFATGKKLQSFKANPSFFFTVVSPDGTALLGRTTPQSSDIHVWDLQSGKEKPALTGHGSSPFDLRMAFTPDGKTLITGAIAGEVLVRDWPSGRVRSKIKAGLTENTNAMFVTQDGKALVLQDTFDPCLRRFDLASGKALYAPGELEGEVVGFAAAPEGSLVSLSRYGMLRTWDLNTGRQTQQLEIDASPAFTSLAISPDGKQVAIDHEVNGPVMHDRQTGKAILKMPAPNNVRARRLLFSPDGRFLAGHEMWRDMVRVWDTTNGKEVASIKVLEGGRECPPLEEELASVVFSPDGRWLVISIFGRTQLWQVNGWKRDVQLPNFAGEIAFSPDARTMAYSFGQQIWLNELSTSKVRAMLQAKQSIWPGKPGVVFSPDGRFLAWLAGRRTIEVWDLYRSARVALFEQPDSTLRRIAFSRASNLLVSGGSESSMLVWEIPPVAAAAAIPRAEKDLLTAWDSLGSDDAAKAYKAGLDLCNGSQEGVALIRDRLRPVPAKVRAPIQKLLDDLDSPVFATREQATKELHERADDAKEPLKAFLAGNPTDEARRRGERLLAQMGSPTTEQMRQWRAVEVLERIGNEEAKALLKRLAGGDQHAALTRDAAASLRRLERK